MPMIAIRVDASTQIGSGHLMRCLALASQLRAGGAQVCFICREHPGHLCNTITDEWKFPVHRLPCDADWKVAKDGSITHAAWLGADWEDDARETVAAIASRFGRADWLVVDHYALDAQWESALKQSYRQLMVIDDLADRNHDCDILLDQNFYLDQCRRYDGLLPPRAQLLLGPRYALLRTEFLQAQQSLRTRDGTIRKILMYFGSSDISNETAKAMRAIRAIGRPDIAVDMVIGPTNAHRSQLEKLAACWPSLRLYFGADMARLIGDADLGIGAGGATTWERCLLGLPTLTVVVATNQLETTLAVASLGALWYLGLGQDLSEADYRAAVEKRMQDPEDVRGKSLKALEIMKLDGVRSAASLLLDYTDRTPKATGAGIANR